MKNRKMMDLLWKSRDDQREKNKPSVLVALINCMVTLRLKMAVEKSTTLPVTSVTAPKILPGMLVTPPLGMDVKALKSNTFLGINTTVPLIFWLLSKTPNIFALLVTKSSATLLREPDAGGDACGCGVAFLRRGLKYL